MSNKTRQIHADVQPTELVDVPVQNGRHQDDLGELFQSLAIHQTDVLACRPYNHRSQSVVLLVTLDETKLQQVLDEVGLEYNPEPSVLIRWRYGLGFAARIGTYLQDAGIKILCSYASPPDRDAGCIVLKTSDDEAALRLLKDCPWGMSIEQACSIHPRKLLAAQWPDPSHEEPTPAIASKEDPDATFEFRVEPQWRGKKQRNVLDRLFDPADFDMLVC